MAVPLWKLHLQPASFNGVGFHADVDSKASGRRIVPFEFPKQDTPSTEDMGRRIRRFTVRAYIIYSPVLTPDYQAARDALIAVLETEGAGLLVHPTLGTDMVVVDTYSVTESRERGGIAEFEINFYEAGQNVSTQPTVNTAAQVGAAAQSAIGAFQDSTDITTLPTAATG